jgi:hypothetical protein
MAVPFTVVQVKLKTLFGKMPWGLCDSSPLIAG